MLSKVLRVITLFFFVASCASLFTILLPGSLTDTLTAVIPLFYWSVLTTWILLIIFYRLKSTRSMGIGLMCFILGALLDVVGLVLLAEQVMKLGFVFFVVGNMQAIIEYKVNEKK